MVRDKSIRSDNVVLVTTLLGCWTRILCRYLSKLSVCAMQTSQSRNELIAALSMTLSDHTHLVSMEGSWHTPSTKCSFSKQCSKGPLLFLIYINDLPAGTPLSTTLPFADNAPLLLTILEPHCCSQVQQDLDSLPSWCWTWNLSLNTNKRCVVLQFSLSSNACTIYLNPTNPYLEKIPQFLIVFAHCTWI